MRKLWPLLCLLVLLAGCSVSAFDGSRALNEDGFSMTYTMLNRQEQAVLHLENGDSLQVQLAHTGGNIDLAVGLEGEAPIYQGTGLDNAAFTLNIHQAGDYTITVTGHKAAGSIALLKR